MAGTRGMVPVVHHDKERRHVDPRFASGQMAGVKAGRGQRRGLDGPTLPKPTKKGGGSLCPNHRAEPAVRRACTWGDGAPGHRGHCSHAYEAAERGQGNAARTNLDRTPSESGRSGRIQGARSESSQVRGRRDAARAAPSARSGPLSLHRNSLLKSSPELPPPHLPFRRLEPPPGLQNRFMTVPLPGLAGQTRSPNKFRSPVP
jgi:hypothetical protein